jgi:hypothetical protein
LAHGVAHRLARVYPPHGFDSDIELRGIWRQLKSLGVAHPARGLTVEYATRPTGRAPRGEVRGRIILNDVNRNPIPRRMAEFGTDGSSHSRGSCPRRPGCHDSGDKNDRRIGVWRIAHGACRWQGCRGRPSPCLREPSDLSDTGWAGRSAINRSDQDGNAA